MISLATDPIHIGDVWECHRSAHKGSQIRITGISDSNVEFVVTHGHDKRQSRRGRDRLLRGILQRDFILVHSVAHKAKGADPMSSSEFPRFDPATQITSVANRICSNCGNFLPIEQFDFFTGNARKANPEGRLSICHSCVVQKRGDGVRRAAAERKEQHEADAERLRTLEAAAAVVVETPEITPNGAATEATYAALDLDLQRLEPVPTPDPEPKPEPVPVPERPRGSFATALLELAAQADAIEHPAAYKRLYAAMEAAARRGTDAGAVFVIPSDDWFDIQVALEAATADLEPPAPPAEPHDWPALILEG